MINWSTGFNTRLSNRNKKVEINIWAHSGMKVIRSEFSARYVTSFQLQANTADIESENEKTYLLCSSAHVSNSGKRTTV